MEIKKIILAGNFTTLNLDSEILLSSLLGRLQSLTAEFELLIVSPKPELVKNRYQIPAVDCQDLSNLIPAIQQADVVVVCGDAFMIDVRQFQSVEAPSIADLPLGFSLAYLCALYSKPCLGYSVVLTNLNEETTEEFRWAFQLCDWISVRDHASLYLLKSLFESNLEDWVQVVAATDPVFTQTPAEKNHPSASRELAASIPESACLVFLSYNSLTRDFGNQNALSAAFDLFLENTPGKVVFLPVNQDYREGVVGSIELAVEIQKWMKHKDRVVLVDRILPPDKTAEMTAKADLVLAIESTGVIFALEAGKPVVGLTDDEHVADVMGHTGLEKWIYTDKHWKAEPIAELLEQAGSNQNNKTEIVQDFIARQGTAAQESIGRLIQQMRHCQPVPSRKQAILGQVALQIFTSLHEKNKEIDALKETALQAQQEAIEAKLAADYMRGRIAFWVQTFWNIRQRFAPPKSRRAIFLNKLIWYISELVSLRLFKRVFRKVFHPPAEFEDRYQVEDFSQVKLYSACDDLMPDYKPRHTLQGERTPVKVSLISTLRNEESSAVDWMKSIYAQTRLPDEIILLDAGSTDATVEILNKLAADSPVPLRIIVEKKANISRGRNLAIEQAQYPVIAVSDFGCRPEPAWLENIIAPFELDPKTEVVAGWYEVVDRDGKSLHRPAWPTLKQVYPQSFIPSSRSIAFTRSSWSKVGKYPEWFTLTGEDTYFAMELKRYCAHWAFTPEAVVIWKGPDSAREYFKKIYSWSIGDGESGLNGSYYWTNLKVALRRSLFVVLFLALLIISVVLGGWGWLGLMVLLSAGGLLLFREQARRKHRRLADLPIDFITDFARVGGYLAGYKRRRTIDQRRLSDTQGVFIIFAGVPINDTGGGSRGTQIALELLRQNYMVVYINNFGSYEVSSLRLKICHPNLFNYPHASFRWKKFYNQFKPILDHKPVRALVEFPLKEFLPLIVQVTRIGGKVAYDLLDDWDTSLGADWYNPAIEKNIIQNSQVLVATAPVLVERLEKLSRRKVQMVPNAVNLRLFNNQREYLCPPEFDNKLFRIIYIGALWGDWFDWPLLIKVAESFKDAQVYVIGDYRGQSPKNLHNLKFMGLKPQASLPQYLAYSNVAIIPWKVNKITLATSPLKIYEYLAMGVPTVVPNLPLLKGIPLVYPSKNRTEFILNIHNLRTNQTEGENLQSFLYENSWEYRVKQLDSLMAADGHNLQRLEGNR